MKVLKSIADWIYTFAIAFIITFLISIFLFQPFKVEGHSMDPTLHNEQRIFISKIQHTLSGLPEYGDIVVIDSRIERERSFKDDVLEFPLFQLILRDTDHAYYVKRVIGKPGDAIEIKNGILYRNDVVLEETYIKEPMNYSSEQKWVVPEDHLFVMGDNRNNSLDSRSIGFIPAEHFLGVLVWKMP